MKPKAILLLGAVAGIMVQAVACSSDFRSCYDTRTCAPTAGAPNGEAGSDESAGAIEPGGAGSTSTGGADQSDAGAAGDGAGGASTGRAGADVGGATNGGSGGTSGSDGGGAGNAGAGGGALVFGTCRAVPQGTLATITAIKAAPTAPTLTQGQLLPGRYRRSANEYYLPSGEFGSTPSDVVDVEVKETVAALYFNHETWLISMGTPATAAPQSIKVSCAEPGSSLGAQIVLSVGVEQKDQVSYQVTADGFQLLISLGGGGWFRVHYVKAA